MKDPDSGNQRQNIALGVSTYENKGKAWLWA